MAGGLGKRMMSDIPKVLHHVKEPYNINNSYPMIIHILKKSIELKPKKIFIIVGYYKDIIKDEINNYINTEQYNIEYIYQDKPNGTGHAILSCITQLLKYRDDNVIILSGDVPLISINTLNNLQDTNNKILITELNNPKSFGRILFDKNNNISCIKEEKDCNDNEKLINIVNCGIYQFRINDLCDYLPLINNNNASNEYYLTDIIDILIKNNISVNYYKLDINKNYEIKNINTQNDLKEINDYIIEYLS